VQKIIWSIKINITIYTTFIANLLLYNNTNFE